MALVIYIGEAVGMSFLTVIPAVGFGLMVASGYVRHIKRGLNYVQEGLRRSRGGSAMSQSQLTKDELPLEMTTPAPTVKGPINKVDHRDGAPAQSLSPIPARLSMDDLSVTPIVTASGEVIHGGGGNSSHTHDVASPPQSPMAMTSPLSPVPTSPTPLLASSSSSSDVVVSLSSSRSLLPSNHNGDHDSNDAII